MIVLPESAADVVRAMEFARTLGMRVAPQSTGHDYYNFVETPAGADPVLPPDAYRRLGQVKARYDPDHALISAHPVRPAGA